MPRKSEQEVLKAEHDRIQEENKYCADCDAKGPRWASWNLGVFLCIRCAGIHRNLGVHLTRVKSVNLDTWTPEQVQSMRVMGNAKAKIAYEAGLPEHFRRPQTDQALETFIRAKYEHKRYILKDWTPPKANVADLPGCGGVEDGGKGAKPKKTTTTLPLPSSRSSVPTISSTTQKSVPTVKSHQPIPDASVNLPSSDLQLVDLSSPPPIVSSQPPIVSYSSQFATDQPIANEGISDIFGPIVSTTVAAVGNSSTAPPTPCIEQHSPSMTHSGINSMSDPNFLSLNETNDATHKSNSDILALFRNNTSNSQQQPNFMSQQQYAPPSSLLAGLYTPTPPPPTYHQQPYHNTGYAPPQPPSLINTATPDFGMFPNSGAYQQFTNIPTQQQQPSNDFGAFMQSSMTTKSSSTFGQLSATNGGGISRSTGSMAPPTATATAVDFDINLWR